jgi:hypothetical protein
MRTENTITRQDQTTIRVPSQASLNRWRSGLVPPDVRQELARARDQGLVSRTRAVLAGWPVDLPLYARYYCFVRAIDRLVRTCGGGFGLLCDVRDCFARWTMRGLDRRVLEDLLFVLFALTAGPTNEGTKDADRSMEQRTP